MVILWMIITIPIAAVAVIDAEFTFLAYGEFLGYAIAYSLGFVTITVFSFASLGELLCKQVDHFIWAIPVGLGVSALFIFMGFAGIYDSLTKSIWGWGGFAIAWSILFITYWTSLWFEKVILIKWRSVVRRR